MKKILMILPILALMIVSVLATSCYQESANVSTTCGGLDTGKYVYLNDTGGWNNQNNITDGNWNTYDYIIDSDIGTAYVYINYTKPNNALNSSLWSIKDNTITINLTIISLCWEQTSLQFRIRAQRGPSQAGVTDYQCYNGVDWYTLHQPSNLGFYTKIYEEAMWWNITNITEPTDCDYYTGDTAFNLPQINIQGSYTNDATHQTYLACLYNLNGIGNYEIMSLTNSCRLNPQSFNPDTTGSNTYKLSIAYMIREWNQLNHAWETISSGTDNSLEYTFDVCGIPADEGGYGGFIAWLQGLLCSLFGWFC